MSSSERTIAQRAASLLLFGQEHYVPNFPKQDLPLFVSDESYSYISYDELVSRIENIARDQTVTP